MIKKLVLSLFAIAYTLGISAEGISYTKADSIKVVQLLNAGKKENPSNLMIFYAKKLLGLPYVAHTLEVNDKEQLVVNLRQLDCTTYTETVFALALTTKHGSVSWSDYCKWLTTIRYNAGKINGYPSRNHYFLWWMDSNKQLGLITTPSIPANVAASQKININYMTAHPDAYRMLKGNKKDIEAIGKMEKASYNRVVKYIPVAKLGLSKKSLSCVHDGDILAIATKKAGLDTTHIGIASWGKDGKLHLLNASQIHKKVVLEPMTLLQYMKKHPANIGVWVLRPVL